MANYRSTIKTRGFLFIELKKAAALQLQGFTPSDIKNKVITENIFLFKTINRRKEIAATVLERLKMLDDFLCEKLIGNNLETGKMIALYSIIKTDRLFFEYMQGLFRKKLLLRDYIILDSDFNAFFQQKIEQSRQLAAWTDYTFYKLIQAYKKILLDAGLAKRGKGGLVIRQIFVEPDLCRHIVGIGDGLYLKAMQGEF